MRVVHTCGDVEALINGMEVGDGMGTCSYCGARFEKTRSTKKYCTARCKTNACLNRKPSRLRAKDVQALYALLERDFATVEVLHDELRAILMPAGPRLPLSGGRIVVPRLD